MAPSMIDVGTFFADEMMAFGCKMETCQDGSVFLFFSFVCLFVFFCLFFILLIMSYGCKLETHQDGSADKW